MHCSTFTLQKANHMANKSVDETLLASLIEASYAAALDAQQWHAFTKLFARSLDSAACLYYVPHGVQAGTHTLSSAGFDPVFAEAYNAYFAAKNVLVERAGHKREPVLLGGDVISTTALQRTEFYGDWMRPQKFQSAINIRLGESATSMMSIAIMRPQRSGSFDTADKIALQRLVPHLRRSHDISTRLRNLQLQAAAGTSICHRLQLSSCVVDGTLRVLHLSADAERLLDGGHGIRINQDTIRLSHPIAHDRLRKAVAAATSHVMAREGSFLRLEPGHKQSVGVHVCPVSDYPGSAQLLPRPAAFLLFSDPSNPPRLNEAELRRRFALTRAEVRLSIQLCRGLSVEEAALQNSVRVSTVRSHLHTLLIKTEAKRQADVVRMLLTDMTLYEA
jgi:DNA-binding CsgD family transcriptional regulator